MAVLLDDSFFELILDLQRSRSFDDLSGILSLRLSELVEGDGGVVLVVSDVDSVHSIRGESPIALEATRRFAETGGPVSVKALSNRLDWSSVSQRGFSVADGGDAALEGCSDLFALFDGEEGFEDALVGKVCNCYQRATVLLMLRRKGRFDERSREKFDAVLLTARAVADRLSIENLETQIRKFYFSRPPSSPSAIFIVHRNGEVLPVNYDAIRLSEKWWPTDDAFLNLPEAVWQKLKKDLDSSWVDPVTAVFHKVEIDLGGGATAFYGLPRRNGEVILLRSLSDRAAEGEAAVAAMLTKRQQEIMGWIAEGKTSGEVAIILNISPRTVEKHLEAVFQRLGVENRIAAVRRYLDLKTGNGHG